MRVFTLILIIIFSVSGGFILGTGQNKLPIVYNLTVQLETLQTELNLLKRELSKKTGIVVQPETQTAEIALNKAETLVQQGQFSEAALYFSNAWANKPEWQTLQRYQQAVLQYCHKLLETGDLETALQLLADMDNFLRAQTAHLTVSEIEQLQQMLLEIKKLHQETASKLLEKSSTVAEPEKTPVHTEMSLQQRAENFLNQAVQEPNNSELTLYYLTAAQSVVQQMVLSATDENAKVEAAQLSEQLEKTKQTISSHQSKAVWDEINQGLEVIAVTEVGKAEDILQQWLKRRQFLAERMNKLTAPEFLRQAQEVMEKINSEINQWQTEQQRRYDRWAMSQIEAFFNQFKQQGKDTDLGFLGEIDTRYLSFPTTAAYNEVFGAYYGKLDTERKIAASAQLMLARKQKLSRF